MKFSETYHEYLRVTAEIMRLREQDELTDDAEEEYMYALDKLWVALSNEEIAEVEIELKRLYGTHITRAESP